MSEARIREINKARGTIKAKLTQFGKYVEACTNSTHPLTEIQLTELELRLSKIESLHDDFDKLQTEFEALSESKDDELYLERDQFDTKYFSLVAQAGAVVGTWRARDRDRGRRRSKRDSGSDSDDGSDGGRDFVRLPKIDLPKFDGEFQHWLEFRDTYISLIHNNKSLSKISKFHYLRGSLKGHASMIIKGLEFSTDNYDVAWNLLSNRYDNERLLVSNHVNALFNLEKTEQESSQALRNIVDVTNKNLCSLASLGQPTDHWDTLVIHIMSKKLDKVTFREWEEHRNTITGYPTLKQFNTFLTNRADLLDTVQENTSSESTSTQKYTPYYNKNNKQNSNTSNKLSSFNTDNKMSCPMCKQGHLLFSCQEFRNLDINTRIQKMKDFKVCRNCLRPGHTDKQCNLTHCKYCTYKHNTLLHKEKEPETQNNLVLSADIQNTNRSYVLLSTALVKVADSSGRLCTARLLLDCGSTSNFVTRHLCEKLGLVRRNTSSTVVGINSQFSHSAESCDITIHSYTGDYSANLSCYVLPQITQSLPMSYIDIKDLPLPSGIQLADPSFNTPSAIDILVGAEIFWDVLTAKCINLGNKGPKLQHTKLGWLVSGAIHLNQKHPDHKHTQKHPDQTHTSCYFIQNDDTQLTRFWELESVSSKHCLSPEEQACERSFADNTRRDNDGRFVVTIPLKDSPEVLGDSYSMAKRRFLSVERRLERDSLLKERYLNFMSEYLTLGHMTENTQNTDDNINYYMPHHGVIREASLTSKLRVVFDASAVTTSGKSFNNIQMVGPVVQDDLLSILLRFRQHKYVVSSDVEKMYRAILVEPSQRSLQQILFRFSPSEPIKSYTLNTVTYGTASAPYLATKCLVSLAEQCTNSDAQNSISRDFYVDDFLSGGDSISSVVELCKHVIETFQSAKFNLRKWQSNNKSILQAINVNSDQVINEKPLDLDESLPNKTLGLLWDSNSDKLLFSVNLNSEQKKVTKRLILSLISQVFDPLGLLGPFTVEAKMMMQKLWIDKYSWDDEVSIELKTKFLNFIQSLTHLNSVRIPRWICCDTAAVFQIHTFTDASERAYGACVYIRTVDREGRVCVRLLASKNKVAPIKPVTIPRLELCGALLGSRLCTKVLQSLTIKFQSCHFWTDSMIVLAWLKTSPSRLKTFVRNRIGEIQDSTADNRWSYVPSKANPADLVSRGVSADQITASSLWWSGPSFLHQTHIQYPKLPNTNIHTSLPEISLHTDTEPTDSDNRILQLIQKKSDYNRLIRSIAYIHRFIHNCRQTNKHAGNLTVSELYIASIVVLRMAQQEMFPNEYNIIKSRKSLPSKSRLIRLSPFIDSYNILRVGGRLKNSNYSYDVKHPILLCGKHHLTHIIFHKQHISLFHGGPQLLLSHVRQTYWPLGGRNLARRTVHSCVRCFRLKAKSVQPLMGDLPLNRTHLEFPFLHTGIDYAGPVLISDRKGRGSRLTKAYICVFVCFAVKALHLELVTDLTKEAFIAALHRFMSRRGKPQTISSDNGTTFVGANNELTNFFQAYSDDIQSDIANQGIDFKFIPPYTPHFGGLWESAVKSVKHHLRRILSLTHLTYEEMSTCLVQIEAILNSRPLTPLSPDPSDLTCLTPAHFLIGRTLLSVPQPQVTETNISRLQRYERVEKLKQHFWQRFSQDYVSLLQQKTKWMENQDDIKMGSLVLVRDKGQPPLLWLLGRVTKVHPGRDGISRVAEINTKKGSMVRAFNNICPLPVPLC